MKVRGVESAMIRGYKIRSHYPLYYGHRISPKLALSSRTAWALAFEAGQRRMYYGDLVAAICESWASSWEEQLGETDRRRFVESIPHHRKEESKRQG